MINKSLLRYLCCPKCKKSLKCKDNILLCINCKFTYYIREDIPILIDPKSIRGHLKHQVNYFEKESNKKKKYKLEEWQKSYVNRFNHNFNLQKKDIVIDCGTGSGYMAIELAKKGAIVFACDLTFKSLLILQQYSRAHHLEKNLFLICCNAESLPIRSDVADFLISNAVLEHLPLEYKAIMEMNRVAKKKCGLMITVPIRFRYINPLFIPLNFIHDKIIGHLRRYDLNSLIKKFTSWSVVNTYYTGHFLKVLCVILNSFTHIIDEKKIELNDQNLNKNIWGSSNICVFFKKLK